MPHGLSFCLNYKIIVYEIKYNVNMYKYIIANSDQKIYIFWFDDIINFPRVLVNY